MHAPSRGGRGLAGLIVACALLVAALLGVRLIASRSPREVHPIGSVRALESSSSPASGAAEQPSAREELAVSSAPDSPAQAAAAAITGRLQINGFAARRGRVWIRTQDGGFEQELAIDPHGRFYVEGVPAGELLLGFEAEGLFERQLVLPDRQAFEARAGELEVLDLDWWTRQVNVFIGGEEGEPRAARVELSGPSYSRAFEVEEGGIVRLDLVGQGIFTFRARTVDGREDSAELELESGDELDSVVLVPRVKKS